MRGRTFPCWMLSGTVMTLAGCRVPQSLLESNGPAAGRLANLGWFVIVVGCVVSAIVITLVLVGGLRRHGTFSEHAPYNTEGGKSWVLWGGLAIPAVILAIVYVSTLSVLHQFPMDSHRSNQADITVVGHQWWWEIIYRTGSEQIATTANEIHIPVGRTVEINLETRDVIHSFWVPRLHGKVDLIPGQTNHIRIRANEPGTYRGQCAEFCGAQHAHMAVYVVAQSQAEYEAWLTRERSPAVAPLDSLSRMGQRIFQANACTFCHTIRGTQPGGTVAPDLTHLASRQTIAAGTLSNTRGNLEAWVVNAPSLKPGTQMPRMTQFTGSEIQALVAYLESLK